MKKLTIKRLQRTKKEAPARITNDTVAEHRERILAGGRRFKYPVQYARHKLVFNTVIISVAACILLAAIGWWQLYPMQNSSALMYRLTRMIPVPVAVVDGQQVPYSSYLVEFRPSKYYLQNYNGVNLTTDEGKRQLTQIKRQSLTKAEQSAYAQSLAGSLGVSVTEKDVTQFIEGLRDTVNGTVSQDTYDASMRLYYDESPSDRRARIKDSIIKVKVAFAVDAHARQQVAEIKKQISAAKGNFATLKDSLPKDTRANVSIGQSGLIDSTSRINGLWAKDLVGKKHGAIIGPFKSVTDDGYYFVNITKETKTQISFDYLRIPLTQFAHDFEQLRHDGKINEYITVVRN